jgi:hypothetical protein
MGICFNRDSKVMTLSGVPPEELRVYQSECCLRLNEIMFEDFFAAVKRFGFQSDLSDEHIQKIAPEINLDYKEMTDNELSPFCVFYKNEEIMSAQKRYSVKSLLQVGWLVC